ncbi:Fatty acid desaturase subfamily [Synechococcus sp. PCC 7335]|uniref:fatty acid desaturase family protein n=1 Tax=Synechococcus sp. (strain ATCC 29403 / PCC 7335) TaxID=91464 RepID=UPI00017EBC04|nr:Fatty acid desaturase subfamily [Synechococcus sp. PCC 7335]
MMLDDGLASVSPDSGLNPRQLLTKSVLESLNQRSNLAGALRFGTHLATVAVTGWVWAQAAGWWQVPALILYGVSLAFMFCSVHECVHRTAFATPRVNDAIAWLAGLLSFYNSTFYRRYHKWHHRYTRIPGKDPELTDLEPKTLLEYLWVLSGIPWWKGKIIGHIKVALGQFDGCFYLPESAYDLVTRSTRLQLATYGVIFLLSSVLGHPWFIFTYWLLPLAFGQPFLRFVLLAEHTGCTYDDNPLANTRTTLTLWPLTFLMWNMPYHAEHHLYPSIPFHALPEAHAVLKDKFETVDPGYVQVNREIVQGLG